MAIGWNPPKHPARLKRLSVRVCQRRQICPCELLCDGTVTESHKTLQGTYGQWVFPEGESVSRRAMHEAVFEAGWDRDALMVQHRQAVAQRYQGQGRQVLGFDWTLAHHERSRQIYGVKRSFDYVNNWMSRCQTVMTAAVSDRQTVDA